MISAIFCSAPGESTKIENTISLFCMDSIYCFFLIFSTDLKHTSADFGLPERILSLQHPVSSNVCVLTTVDFDMGCRVGLEK